MTWIRYLYDLRKLTSCILYLGLLGFFNNKYSNRAPEWHSGKAFALLQPSVGVCESAHVEGGG